MAAPSATYRMANLLVGGRLPQILSSYRAQGLSNEAIAKRLYAEYQVDAASNTVGAWLAKYAPGDDAA